MKRDWLSQRITAIVLVTVMSLAWAIIVNAEEKKMEDGWQFKITPFLWLPSIDGTIIIDQPPGFASGKLPVGPGNYLENLDFVGMLDLQAHKGRLSFLADIISLRFSDNESAKFPGVLPGGGDWSVGADWDLEALVLEFAGGYTVLRDKQSNFDLLGGVRYASLETGVSLDIAGTLPPWASSRTFSNTETYVDLIIGFKGNFELGKKWYLPYYFDIGGFGLDSDLTLQAYAGIGYGFCDWFSTALGYRYLYYDFGNDGRLLEDLILHGVTFGFTFNF